MSASSFEYSNFNGHIRSVRESVETGFLQLTLKKVSLLLLITVMGIGLNVLLGGALISLWIQLILLIGLIIGLYVAAYHYKNPGATLACALLLAFMLGFFLGPLIQFYLGLANGPLILFMSAAVVTGIFFSVYLYLQRKGKEAKISHGLLLGLFIALIGIGILAVIFPFQSLIFLHACIGIGLFTLYLIADIGVAMFRYQNVQNPKEKDILSTLSAVDIYLDLINLFLALLELFGNSERGNRSTVFTEKALLFIVAIPLVLSVFIYYAWKYFKEESNNQPNPAVGLDRSGQSAVVAGSNRSSRDSTTLLPPIASSANRDLDTSVDASPAVNNAGMTSIQTRLQ